MSISIAKVNQIQIQMLFLADGVGVLCLAQGMLGLQSSQK